VRSLKYIVVAYFINLFLFNFFFINSSFADCPTGSGDVTVTGTCSGPISITDNTYNSITIDPNSEVTGTSGISISNSGTIGSITTSASTSFIYGNSGSYGGGIYNQGTITSAINNSGKILDQQGDPSIYNDGGTIGTITNNSGGIIGTGIFNTNIITSIINNGSIQDDLNTIPVLYRGNGIFNSGTINSILNTNSISGGQQGGIYNIGRIPLITNSGTIEDLYGGAGIQNNGGTIDLITNELSGIINGGSRAYGPGASQPPVGIYNSKIIAEINNYGIIKGSSSGGIYNDYSGSITTIVNYGTIQDLFGGDGIYNLGTIGYDGSTYSSNGIVNNGTSSTANITSIYNNGIISGTQSGIINSANGGIATIGTITNDYNGNIGWDYYNYANTGIANYALNGGSANIASIINNSGESGGIIAGTTYGILNSAESGGTANIGAITNNYGSISGDRYGIYNSANDGVSNIGTIINSGIISGTTGGIYNSGTIGYDGSTYSSIGVENLSDGTISSIINEGTISGTTAGIHNLGIITTLNNSQGKKGGSSNPLTYSGNLPVNYNITINSTTNYGQLAVASGGIGTGSMVFGITPGSVVANNTKYINVLQGLVGTLGGSTITGADFIITQATGTYGGYNYTLAEDGLASLGDWDLIFGTISNGPSAADTQKTINYNAEQTKNLFNQQISIINAGFNYDCKNTSFIKPASYKNVEVIEQRNVAIPDRVFFPTNDYKLTEDAKRILTQQADFLIRNNLSMTIMGYADERGTREYNLALGQKRADAVKAFLIYAGVNKDDVNVVSYGKENPENPESNVTAWAQNRRSVTLTTIIPEKYVGGEYKEVKDSSLSPSDRDDYKDKETVQYYKDQIQIRRLVAQKDEERKLCMSVGGVTTSAQKDLDRSYGGLITASYSPNDNFRFGGYLNQNANISSASNIFLSNAKPAGGLFVDIHENKNGAGFSVHSAVGYTNNNLTVTRVAVGDAEPGSGTSNLSTLGLGAEVSYGIKYSEDTLYKQYLGLTHLSTKRSAYTEGSSDAVTTPLTYSQLKEQSTAVTLGINVETKATSSLVLNAKGGFDYVFNYKMNNYSASGVSDLTGVNIGNNNEKSIKPSILLSANYEVDNTSQVVVQGQYLSGNQQTPTNTVNISYQKHF
jgi:peptidoglycan-associated lipoprotein